MRRNRMEQIKNTQKASNFNVLFSIILLMIFLLLFGKNVKSQDKIIGFNAYGSIDNGGNGYQINTDGSNYAVNAIFPYSISGNPTDMVDGNDGYIYANGPGNGYTTGGVIFKVKYDGSNYTILRKFTLSTDGSSPRFRPVLGTDGFVYGLNESGGANNSGTIWRVKRDGTLFSVIYNFPASTGAFQNYLGAFVNVDYSGFFGSLTFGLDGKLYGLCGGGSLGTHLFRLNTNGSGFSILLHGTGYSNSPIPGSGIASPLTLGSDGNFYGCFTGGGLIDFAGGKGVIFKFNPTNNAYTLLHYFTIDGLEGKTPYGLAEGSGGFLYGLCYNLGIPNGIETDHGTLWKIAKDGTGFSVLKQLSADTTGNGTNYKILAGLNNKIYFSTHSNGHPLVGTGAGGCFMSINPDGTGFRVLRNDFEGNSAPHSFFFRQDTTGAKFFGVSGISTDPLIYTMDTLGGRYTPIHKLSYSSYGYAPNCKPVVVTNPASSQNGFVFGVAAIQGVNNCGTMFKYAPALTSQKVPEMVSYMRNVTSNYRGSILGNYTPLLASDGKLYGTYSLSIPFVYNVGTDAIYQLPTATNSEPVTIKQFSNLGPTACSGFNSNLIEGDDGYIYGTTSSSFSNVYGTIYKMQKDGSNYSNIYFFPAYRGYTNSLLQDPVTHKIICSATGGIFSINTDGTAYTPISLAYAVNPGIVLQGDTLFGIYGSGSSWGVYKVHKNATGFTSLRTFTGSADGYYPNSEITIGTDGFIYGTCGYGGTYGYGTLFKMDKNGNSFSVLRHFTGAPDGGQPGPVSFMPCTAPKQCNQYFF